MSKTRNAFISFHIADEAQVNLLRAQAKSDRFALDFRDFSVKEPFDNAWKEQCREKIAQTSVTICMIGELTHSREAVDWELETSVELGHKIFGVRIYREANHRVPNILIEKGAPVVDWSIEAVVHELETLSVRCGATTKTSLRACHNRVLGKLPCWRHRPKLEPAVGPLDLVGNAIKDLIAG